MNMSAKTQAQTAANRYEIDTGFGQSGADSECVNCGIGLTEAPDADGVHKIRMLHQTNDGEHLCEACFFHESYNRSGREIVRGELKTMFRARKHREGEPDHHYDYYHFDTHQAASGWARANGGEYLGSTTVDPFKLTESD